MPAEGTERSVHTLPGGCFYFAKTPGLEARLLRLRTRVMRRAVVIANGELPLPDVIAARLPSPDLVIAADGGARHCQALSLAPHVIIGDLDSLAPEARSAWEQAGVRIIAHPSAKDETDLELALLYALERGAESIVVLGALGGRLDMTLANLLLLTHPRLAAARVEFWHGHQTAWLLRPPGQAIAGQPGDTLSLIPVGGEAVGVLTEGLLYPLRDETLTIGPARGVSNVLTEPAARVTFREGMLLATLTSGQA